MEYGTLVLVLIALGLAFASWRRHHKLQMDLVRTRSMIFDLSRGVRDLREELNKRTQDLRFEIRKSSGMLKFEKTMTVAEAMEVHPSVREIFANFHLGGCAHCAINEQDTIEQVARSSQIDLEVLLSTLNGLLNPEAQPTSPNPMRGGPGLLTIEMPT